jgi:TolB-like protein/Flp pilus assembly protein TadD
MMRADPSSLSEPGVLAPEQSVLVRKHLEEILTSHTFAGSRRTQDFLRLIVGHALDGDIDNLRERMIGAEMFGRPVSYDTGSDSVVRVRASEVRKKLAQYYVDTGDKPHPVRIDLPSGSYVPRFHFIAHEAINVPATDTKPVTPFPAKHVAAPISEEVGLPSRVRRSFSARAGVVIAVTLVLIVVAAYFGLRKWMGNSNSAKGIHSIAILPLENLSGAPEQDYFADGMTEELINDLGQVSTLRVISLTSSMSYKGTKKKLPEIARELSVDGVIEGGVLREGNQVQISVQLIDSHSDRQIWAHTYNHDLAGVLSWQGEVAQAIANEISTQVTPQEQARLAQRNPIDPQAQDLFLHGILLRQQDNCSEAIGYFNRAIAINPAYAEALSSLASCYGMLGESGRMPYEEAFVHQKAEAALAIQLDNSLSEAHAELANSSMTLDWNWASAAAEFHRALELNPNSATSHEKYAFYLLRTGQLPEALAEVQRSVDLDPISDSTFHAEGFVYYFSRQYDQSLTIARTVHDLKINLHDWNFLLGDNYAEKHMFNESIAAFLKAGNDPYTLGHLANTYARAGQPAKANELIARLEDHVKKDGIGRYEIALAYTGLGEKNEAFKWLEDAYRARDVGLVYLKVDPCLDPLRSDPRFNDLMRRLGLV